MALAELTTRMKLMMKAAGEGAKIAEAEEMLKKHNFESELNCVRTGY